MGVRRGVKQIKKTPGTKPLKNFQPDTERAFSQLMEQMTTILDNMRELIVYQDTANHILWANKSAADSVNLTPEDLVGRFCYDVWHQRSDPCLGCPVVRAVKTGKSEQGEVKTPDDRIWLVTGTPVYDDRKNITAVIETTINITERRKIEKALADEVTRRRILIDQSRDGIVVLDQNGKVYESNRRFAEMLGYTPEEMKELYVFDWEYLFPKERVVEMIRTVDEKGHHFETRHRRKDGTTYDVEISTNAASFGDQKLIFCVCRDISDRRRAEQLLRESEEKYRLLTENSLTGIYVHQDGKYVYVNKRFAEMHGYEPEELIGREYILLNHPEDRELVTERIASLYQGDRTWSIGSNRRIKKDGTTIWAQICAGVIDYHGEPAIMGNIIDITESKELEEKLKHIATHDSLTGLPNRILLYDRFNIAIANAQRTNSGLAVLSLDLDNFKNINDTYGHEIGDKVLIETAERLTGSLRKVDTVARIGGDEFVVLLWQVDDPKDAISVATKILEEFRKPLYINGLTLAVTLSIGIAIYPMDGADINSLLRNSDKSMYRAKQRGMNNFKLWGSDT